jgi:hypothetical protein
VLLLFGRAFGGNPVIIVVGHLQLITSLLVLMDFITSIPCAAAAEYDIVALEVLNLDSANFLASGQGTIWVVLILQIYFSLMQDGHVL